MAASTSSTSCARAGAPVWPASPPTPRWPPTDPRPAWIASDPRIPLREESDQLVTRHFLRRGHPTITLRPGHRIRDQRAEIVTFVPATGLFPGSYTARRREDTRRCGRCGSHSGLADPPASYPPSSSTKTSTRPARFRRPAAASTTSLDSDVSLISPNGVTYDVPGPDRPDAFTRSLDVLTASTPNTSNVSGSANAAIAAPASSMAMSITISATRRRPTDPAAAAGQPINQRPNG